MYSTHSMRGETIPQGTGIIDRPRLLQRLQGALDNKLTLITAPPGFGKTTLITQLTRGTQALVTWQTIDERSRDLPNLYSQAINALSSVFPGITQLAPPYGYGPGELATLIGDYLTENLTGDLIYILDDVHQLTGAAPAEAWLRTLVTALPPNCHLIFASRTLPRLPLVEMIARGEVLAIGLDELRFTSDEVTELGAALLGIKPTEEHIQQLTSRLEGWPAGTVLAFHPLPPELEQMAFSGQGGPEALFEALARIMLQTQPRNIRNFLLASATLTRLTPEACAEALDLPNAAEMLREIQTRNLFVSKVPGALVYHMLFRNFLQAELKNSDFDLYVDLHRRAAHWFEASDLPYEAFDHYINAGLPAQAASLADHMALAYFTQNRVETLLAWNNQLRERTTAAPRLAYHCAIIYGDRYAYDEAEERLRETQATRQPDHRETSPAAINVQYGHLSILRRDYKAAINYVYDLTEVEPETTNIRGRALNILGRAAFEMGSPEQAIQYLETALPLYRTYANNYAQAQVLHNLVLAYWRIGRLKDALAALQEVVGLQRSLGGAGPLASALNSLGYCYHQLGDYVHAVAALQEGLSAMARFPNPRTQSYLLYNLADVRRDQGEMEDALSLYDQALNAVGDSEPSLVCTILCGISTLHRWQGQLSEAIAAAQEADQLARKKNIGNEGRIARVALWAAQARTDTPDMALQELKQVVAEFEEHQEQFDLLQTLGVCAHTALLAGQPDLAEPCLDRALALTKILGTSAPLAIEIVHLPPLDVFIRQKVRKFSALISIVDQLRAVQPHVTEELSLTEDRSLDITYSLRIITLGQARVIRDGKAIPTTAWRPAARDLFLYLVFNSQAIRDARHVQGPYLSTHRPPTHHRAKQNLSSRLGSVGGLSPVRPEVDDPARALTRDEICLNFWPNSPAKRARDNFHTTMYRIREVLGENIVMLEEDDRYDEGVYWINPNISIWCDAAELEALADNARALPVADARTEDLWRRAVSLFNGDFLPSLDSAWAVEHREHLHEVYVEALVGLGHCVQARGDYREAIDHFKKAIDAEPYREDIRVAIIDCYIAVGSTHKALAQLNELKTLLRKDLGIGLSEKTLQLERKLRN